MNKQAKIPVLSLIVIVGFAVSVGYHYVQGVYLGRPYPQNTFLFDPAERFGDFSDVLRDGHTLNPYLQFSSAQYPFLALLGSPSPFWAGWPIQHSLPSLPNPTWSSVPRVFGWPSCPRARSTCS